MKKLNEIKIGKRLTEEELKSIKAGIDCYRLNPDNGAVGSFSPISWESAYAWCAFWVSAGYDCRCFS